MSDGIGNQFNVGHMEKDQVNNSTSVLLNNLNKSCGENKERIFGPKYKLTCRKNIECRQYPRPDTGYDEDPKQGHRYSLLFCVSI